MYFWISRWIFLLWYALFVAWVIAAMTSKRSVQHQGSESRLLQIAVQVVAYWLLLGSPFWLRGTVMTDDLLPATSAVALFGLSLTTAGMLFCVWARITIGRNWSGAVTIKQDHQLIRTGPYRLVRHPIYTGLMTAALGTAIVFLRAECFAGVALMTLGFSYKLRIEEQFMLQQFGEEYARYREQVRALIPFVL